MEAEARAILEQAADKQEPEEHLYLRVRRLVKKYGPMEIDIPPRELADDPPDFR
jgi:plasmid stability protein